MAKTVERTIARTLQRLNEDPWEGILTMRQCLSAPIRRTLSQEGDGDDA